MKPMTLPIHDRLSILMLAFKYNNKKQYFDALEWLKDVMDEQLYLFFYGLGKNTYWR